jgi:4-amino-4-deoxy-L-arabinose transferase-like glycosyltransferase
MQNWLPYSQKPPSKPMKNYNNLDRYEHGGQLKEKLKSSLPLGDYFINANPLNRDVNYPRAYTDALFYNYNRGGLKNKPAVIHPINNGRSLLEVDNLDSSNYYNSRK